MKTIYKLPINLYSFIFYVGLVYCHSTQTMAQASLNPYATTTPSIIISPKAPWTHATIKSNQTDELYRKEWVKSDSKSSCPILALPKHAKSHLNGHRVRRASFDGGWGVAYDLPNLRSAYGIANAGTIDLKDTFNDWPYNVTYQDGSILSYGHEGNDASANWLAYLITPQNHCFYNIWSAQSKDHLEQIISDLRKVSP